MAGRITASESQLRPDPKFNDVVLSKFINCVMSDGQKATAQRVVYDALEIIQKKLEKETDPNAPKTSLEVFQRAVENAKPAVEVRSKRVGGANYQVPIPVNKRRQQSLSFRWIIQASRGVKGRPMASKLADELYMAARNEGAAIQTKDQTHRMAEANRAFAHFAR